MPSTPIRILVADDHPIFRDGFKVLLKEQQQIILQGEANDGLELLRQVTALQPDVVITDIKMPGMDGVEACRLIKKDFPHIQVIALSMFNDDNLVLDMIEAGASGYLLKNTNKQEMIEAVKAVHEGENFYSAATSMKLTRLIGKSKFKSFGHFKPAKLTERETEIIGLTCEQFTSKEIAAKLDLSIRTVDSHRENIQEKTRSRNLVGIVIYAIRHGIYSIEE